MKKVLLTAIFAIALVFSAACVDSGAATDNSSTSGNEIPSESQVDEEENSTSQGGTEDKDSTDSTDKENEEKEIECLVTFDSDGGSAVAAVSVKKGEKITEPTPPAKSSKDGEYEFLGWFYQDEIWNFAEDTVTEEITLTAQWKLVSSYTDQFLPKN